VRKPAEHINKSGTLLGPEGSDFNSNPRTAIPLELPGDRSNSVARKAGEFLRDRTYFENFTVDASIFVVTTSY
jgi:hypothetical protein